MDFGLEYRVWAFGIKAEVCAVCLLYFGRVGV